MSTLFGIDQSGIARHIQNAFEQGAVDEVGNMQKMHTSPGSRATTFYGVDVVLAVGFSVKSKEGMAFRKRVGEVIEGLVVNGFSVNEEALANNPDAVEQLARIVRRHRNHEVSMYQTVRDVFKASASDYDDDSAKIRAFFALIQDKFLYAVTQKTAAQIIIDRVDARKKDCGLTNVKGMVPTVAEAKISKSYLNPEELEGLENICEQFMLFAKSKVFRGQKMVMEELATKLNILLMANDYPVLYEYKEFLRDKADEKATTEVKKYQSALKAQKNQPLPNPHDEE